MLCDRCQKNEATIHVKKIIGGKIESLHLCAECARETEDNGSIGALGFNLAEVLFNIAGMDNPKSARTAAAPADPQEDDSENETAFCCPNCGWTMEKLQKSNGKLGCPECYKSFAVIIHDAFSRIQRGKIHLGKKPGDTKPFNTQAALQLEIARAKKELAELVRREEFERAAVCRDRLNDLSMQLMDLEYQEGESNE